MNWLEDVEYVESEPKHLPSFALLNCVRSFMSMEMALKQIVVIALSQSALMELTSFDPWQLQSRATRYQTRW